MTTLARFALLFALLLPCLLSATPQTQSFRVAPSYFPNKGQVSDKSVTWYSRGANVSLYLRGTTLTYVLTHRPKSASEDPMKRPHDLAETAAIVDRVDVELVGANPRYEIQAEAPQAGVFHFYLPQCSPGLRDVPHFGRVVCRDVWPGVDMVLGTQGEALKYDFVVKPGADAGQIRLRYGGQDPNLAPDGGLTRPTLAGDLRESAPTAWTTAPDGSRKPVAASWRLAEDGSPYFALGAYDAKESLTIDPIVWGMYLGGVWEDEVGALCPASDGGVFTGGITAAGGFDGFSGTFRGGVDSFLARFSAAGDLIWGSFLGGIDYDNLTSVCPAADGGVFAGGWTRSINFVGLIGGFKGGNSDGFLTRFSADGNLIWGSYLGGSGEDRVFALCAAQDGGFFVGGDTGSSDFAGLSGSFNGETHDGFLIHFSVTSDLIWGSYLGGSRSDAVKALCSAPVGGVYAAIYTESSDFEGLSGFKGGNVDGFLARFSASGSLVWGNYLGGSAMDQVSAICPAQDGGVFLGGHTSSRDFTGLRGGHKGGYSDGFLIRFSAEGDLSWGSYLGGSGNYDLVTALCLTADGDVFAGGYTDSNNFQGLRGVFKAGAYDGFLMHFAAVGDLIGGNYLGGSGDDKVNALCPLTEGGALAGGATKSSEFEGLNNSYKNGGDGFLISYFGSDPPTVDAGPDLDICPGESTRLSAIISPAGNYRVAWTPAEGLDDPNSLNPSAAPSQTTWYVVTVLDTEPPVTDTMLVAVRQSAEIQSIEVAPVTCEDGTITLTLSGGEPPYSVFVNSALTSVETESSFSISIDQAGLYEVRIEDAAGCAVEAEVEVSAVAPLRFMMLSQKFRVQPNQADRVLIFSSAGGSRPVEYSIDGQNYQRSGVFRNLRAGQYTIYARDSQGCVIQREVMLR